jgi:hypothetical protein
MRSISGQGHNHTVFTCFLLFHFFAAMIIFHNASHCNAQTRCLKAWARHNTSPRWSSLSPPLVDWSLTRCSDSQRPRQIEGAWLFDPDGFNIAHPLRLPSHDAQRTKAKRWFSFCRIPTASAFMHFWFVMHRPRYPSDSTNYFDYLCMAGSS